MALTLRLSAILVSFLVAPWFQVLLGLRTSTGSVCRGGCVVAMASEAGSSGYYRAKTPLTNKGTGFSVAERTKFNMRGLLPAGAPQSLDLKVEIAMEQLSLKSSPIEKYIFLHTIMDSDETLYYAILIQHTSKVMPFVYTPTVGEACQKWSTIYRHQPRGVYISSDDAGHVREIFQNQINKDVKVIVMTDGERILGLGDLGSNGMGIPIGKLALYTACAGIDPSQCLPIQVDVGTTTKAIRDDPAYFGLRRDRDRSPAYDALIAEIFEAAQEAFGKNVLIQFEDFGNSNAFRLLEHYQTNACCFNDDIQGTASVVLAGILSSLSLAGKKDISEHTFLFYGAGEAGVGIANMVAMAIAKVKGCSIDQAQKQIWLVDSKGLVTNARSDVAEMKKTAAHKLPYTHAPPASLSQSLSDKESPLLSAIKAVKPTALIGVSAQGGAFDAQVLKTMADINSSPLIFALSNPLPKPSALRCRHTRVPRVDAYLPRGHLLIPSHSKTAAISRQDKETMPLFFPESASGQSRVVPPRSPTKTFTSLRRRCPNSSPRKVSPRVVRTHRSAKFATSLRALPLPLPKMSAKLAARLLPSRTPR